MNSLAAAVCLIVFSLFMMMSITWAIEGDKFPAVTLAFVAGFGLFVGLDQLIGA